MGSIRFKKITLLMIVTWLICGAAIGGLCGEVGSVGGYDVIKIAKATLNILSERKILSGKSLAELDKLLSLQPADPLASNASIIDFYSRLGGVLVERGITAQNEIDAAKSLAAKSGGTKIGGYNPVVLAAFYLDLLVKKNIISYQEAQFILDSSKPPKTSRQPTADNRQPITNVC